MIPIFMRQLGNFVIITSVWMNTDLQLERSLARRVTPFCVRRWERTVYKQYSEQGVNILVYNLICVDSQQRTTTGMRNFSNLRE